MLVGLSNVNWLCYPQWLMDIVADQAVLNWRLSQLPRQSYVYYYNWSRLCHGLMPLRFLRVAVELCALGFSAGSLPVTTVWICPVSQKWSIYRCSWPDKLRFVRFVSKSDTQLMLDPANLKDQNRSGYKTLSIKLWTISEVDALPCGILLNHLHHGSENRWLWLVPCSACCQFDESRTHRQPHIRT